MYTKSIFVSALLAASAVPTFAAPVPAAVAPELELRDLEARLSLPSGALSDILKSFGKGVLSGGAITGLIGLLEGAGSSSSSSSTPATRELEARAGLAGLLEKLLGAGEEGIASVLKKAVIGGVAGGVGVEAVNGIAGAAGANTTSKRGAASVIGTVEKDTLGKIIGSGAADGIGSAIGGLGITAILAKLFGSSSSSTPASSKRALADLSDEEVNTLLEYINDLNGGGDVTARAVSVGSSVGKGVAGLLAGLAATQGTEGIIAEIEKLFPRQGSLDELD